MSSDFTLAATLRTDTGKGASRRLRHAEVVPAIIYGADKDPAMITISHKNLARACEDEAFFSHILNLEVDGKAEQVIIKDMQRHPAKQQIMHADFLRVNANQALHVNVPLHFMNEDICAGVKEGGLISHLISELEVSCLPADLPEFIEVDLSKLEIGDSIHLTELTLPKGVSSLILMQGEDHDQPVAAVHLPRAEKVVEESTEEDEAADDAADEAAAE